jgi:N-acetylglucosamine-6-phosphate deacetylase
MLSSSNVKMTYTKKGACEMTSRLKANDPTLVISIGHSNATFEQAENMIRAGASAVTHVFNCSSHLNTDRDPGVAGLLGSHLPLYFGIIADGIHVHAGSLHMAQKCAGERLTLVTDAISAAGLPDGEHTVADQRITIENGKAVVSATGVLVGSTMFLDGCVREHMAATRSSLAESSYAASTAPAKLLGLSNKGVLTRGSDADITLLSQTGEVLATIVQGDVAFCCPTRW